MSGTIISQATGFAVDVPLKESGSIWSYVVSHQTDWFFDCWYLGSLDWPSYDVQLAVTVLSGCTFAAG